MTFLIEHKWRRGGRAGFTLIEVMIALTILGIGLFLLLQAHYGALRLFAEAQEEVTMHMLMQQVIGRAEADLQAGNFNEDGEFNKRYEDYTYSYEAAPADEEANLGLYEVMCVVEGPQGKKELRFYVYSTVEFEQ